MKGQVLQCLDDRSYEVEANGKIYRRNLAHLRQTNEKPTSTNTEADKLFPVEQPNPVNTPQLYQPNTPPDIVDTTTQPDHKTMRTTRTGRAIKAPTRFTDFNITR